MIDELGIKSDKLNILSFQSIEVINILKEKGIYRASKDIKREHQDYKLDIEQLGGSNPIWGYRPVNKSNFYVKELLDGKLMQKFRCEMSIDYKDLANLFLLDLTLDADNIKIGLTHNACAEAMVFKEDTKCCKITGKDKIYPNQTNYSI